MFDHQPAGWIPPEHREFVEVDLDKNDLAIIRQAMKIYDPVTDQTRIPTDNDIEDAGIKRNTGVIDKRNGVYHPNRYFKP